MIGIYNVSCDVAGLEEGIRGGSERGRVLKEEKEKQRVASAEGQMPHDCLHATAIRTTVCPNSESLHAELTV